MSAAPVLLVGGSGVIGRRTARYLRDVSDVPLLIGGRDAAKAKTIAAEIGNAEGVVLDITASDLGLGDRKIATVAIFLKDQTLGALRFALRQRAPSISISSGVQEIGPEIAAYVYEPHAAPVVLGTEWLVGATTIPALEAAKAFFRIDSIRIGALVDEQDKIGPEADIDLKRLSEDLPAALTRRGGRWQWRTGEDAKTKFRAMDGTEMAATAYSANDVLALATITGASDVVFDLASGVTSSRRRGEPMSTEILIELAGSGHDGAPFTTRHAVVHPEGQVPLTALGMAMVIERIAGISGARPAPGLYFPSQVLDAQAYLARLDAIGGKVIALETVA